MSYRHAWLLVKEINAALREPAVAGATGGRQGGGATVTAMGEQVIGLYRSIERSAHASASRELNAMNKLLRRSRREPD